ncbi:hypothetical protein FXO37_22944 [Capsicum annuum]|nr:hypothetical protein FXO37_22944 [Capsicum annuum]
MDENDSLIYVELRCEYDIYCKCKRVGQATNCKLFRWRNMDQVDERSKFILSRLVNEIKELEQNYKCVKKQLNNLESLKKQCDNSTNMNSVNIEESKQEDECENLQTKCQSLYINTNYSNMKDGANDNAMGDLTENIKDETRE